MTQKRSRSSPKRRRVWPAAAVGLGSLLVGAGLFALVIVYNSQVSRNGKEGVPAQHGARAPILFVDSARQAREFIGYYHTIELTPEQESVKKAALEPRPAACCRNSSAYTCCCTCNLSKTVWGLSNYAIATYDVDAKELDALVDQWLAFVNDSGYDGGTCYRGGCSLAGAEGGCGGMTENELAL